jgi:hypothetical protein
MMNWINTQYTADRQKIAVALVRVTDLSSSPTNDRRDQLGERRARFAVSGSFKH